MEAFGCSNSYVIFGEDEHLLHSLAAESEDVTLVTSSAVIAFAGGKLWRIEFMSGIRMEEYTIGPVSVEICGEPWPSYSWRMDHDLGLVNKVCQDIYKLRLKLEGNGNIFDEVYSTCREEARRRLIHLGCERWLDLSSEICTLSVLGLTPLVSALIDPLVEEVYLDSPGALCYLDHATYGRLWYPAIALPTTVHRLGLLVQLSTMNTFNMSSNSLKGHLMSGNFHCRVSVDSYPLSVDGGSCVIRKFNFKKLDLNELLSRQTLTVECAALMIGCLVSGHSVIISGLPRSGKTTLCNALMRYLPREWRKLSIEEAVETSVPTPISRFVRLTTESGKTTDKLTEITKSLHRSPDFVFVGELQNKEQTIAASMLIDVGIPSLQTVHATDIDGLVARWRDIYGFQIAELNKIILVVFIVLGPSGRKVSKIVAIRRQSGATSVEPLFNNGRLSMESVDKFGLTPSFKAGMALLSEKAAAQEI